MAGVTGSYLRASHVVPRVVPDVEGLRMRHDTHSRQILQVLADGKSKSKSQGYIGQAFLDLRDDQALGAATPVVPEGMSDTLNKILVAIENSKLTLQRDIGKVAAKLGLMHADHQKLSDKVRDVESTITDIPSDVETSSIPFSG
ncbi:hypothetical protein NDU88_005233 [Pleurodeles waltl]|uniref:Uncharacterized protein n=1 Tax=Pleurodeles waltl TaxID=8319 RepID=A0AAV7WAX9_PLEWA|nr:hypothetical protein NDU88_005233 [Pleurodeles waltl]